MNRIQWTTVLLLWAMPVGAQQTPYVRDAGPGRSGRLLRSVLGSRPVVIYRADSALLELTRDSSFASSVVVIGADVTIEGNVKGDLVVVDGDLFLHPGARIEGRAVAIGGAVYNSALAYVGRGQLSFRDNTFAIYPTARGLALDYRSLGLRDNQAIILPGVFGVRIPSYDRVNGLSLRAGPTVRLFPTPIEIDPIATWRTDLGKVDPSLELRAETDRRFLFDAFVGRSTYSNDRWIRSDIVNSLTSFALGKDTRNYYRADRLEARAHRRWETMSAEVTPFIGGRLERAWSVGPGLNATSAPYSVTGRKDTLEGMLRPNPAVFRGTITSALTGVEARWESAGVELELSSTLEIPFSSPTFPGSGRFSVQSTTNADVHLPTFGTQSFDLEMHLVGTAGDPAPPQRFAYLGGSGTLGTFDLLEFGGDHLLFIESLYHIPIDRLVIKYLGVPVFSLRHAIGSAGIGGLPRYEQNVGARISVSVVRFDYAVDPRTRESKFTVGLALAK